MTTHSWIRKAFESKRPRTLRTAPARRRLSLEALEERAVPTVSFGTAVNYSTGGLSPQSLMPIDYNLDGVTDRLVDEGVAAFETSFKTLLAAVADKQGKIGKDGSARRASA